MAARSVALRASTALALGLALSLTAVAGPSGCGGGSFSSADRDAIEALLESQRAAWNRGDLEGFMAGYLHDNALSFVSGGEVQRGWERTMHRYQTRYPDRAAMGELAFSVLEVRPLSRDTALVLGRFTLTASSRAGTGLFTLVAQRRPEGWRIIHDHTSAAPPSDGPD